MGGAEHIIVEQMNSRLCTCIPNTENDQGNHKDAFAVLAAPSI
ncbi:hypothetical protein [Paenibacillus oleatilyticus]|nr:hypothetical protein [Paenibacillus oleatilyticus]